MKFLKGFNPVELITFVYLSFTAGYIVCFGSRIENAQTLLSARAAIAAVIVLLSRFGKNNKAAAFVRFVFPLALTVYWYPETYYLNNDVFTANLDGFFDKADAVVFGCAPSMRFSEIFPQRWFSELMYFGYFSYYAIFAAIGLHLYLTGSAEAESETFTIICSFLIFYAIFIFVPVVGPQFHYPKSEVGVPDGYVFSALMRTIQASGEKPTGAFPSSHAGMTMIYMIIMFKHMRKTFWIYLPIAAALVASTVYIKAHYLVDVVGAFVFTPIIYRASKRSYPAFKLFTSANHAD